MDLDAINKLIDTLIEKQIDEFELEEEGRRIRIRRSAATPVPPPLAPAVGGASALRSAEREAGPQPSSSVPAPTEETGLLTITSPIVGTYYDAPAPGAPEFVHIGDTVSSGQVLCIIEAMKLMNEIEAEQGGTIIKKLVSNGQPVEFGQPLLLLRPSN
ncbi:MAG: acetyl-CoA carboxylase biotin carboxyl carrier protein [Acidobacteria bacterium]|nr:MAG: acetyl-CoA carboxylase biotin carboxyl carrier protein [Acidobacteriota bacterium]